MIALCGASCYRRYSLPNLVDLFQETVDCNCTSQRLRDLFGGWLPSCILLQSFEIFGCSPGWRRGFDPRPLQQDVHWPNFLWWLAGYPQHQRNRCKWNYQADKFYHETMFRALSIHPTFLLKQRTNKNQTKPQKLPQPPTSSLLSESSRNHLRLLESGHRQNFKPHHAFDLLVPFGGVFGFGKKSHGNPAEKEKALAEASTCSGKNEHAFQIMRASGQKL